MTIVNLLTFKFDKGNEYYLEILNIEAMNKSRALFGIAHCCCGWQFDFLFMRII